jgi:DNA-binding MurR/RpiR family transcriptional regulator
MSRRDQLYKDFIVAASKTYGEALMSNEPHLQVMVDPATPASTKVRAADSVLNHTAKAIEIEDIEARVAALEQAAPKGNQNR